MILPELRDTEEPEYKFLQFEDDIKSIRTQLNSHIFFYQDLRNLFFYGDPQQLSTDDTFIDSVLILKIELDKAKTSSQEHSPEKKQAQQALKRVTEHFRRTFQTENSNFFDQLLHEVTLVKHLLDIQPIARQKGLELSLFSDRSFANARKELDQCLTNPLRVAALVDTLQTLLITHENLAAEHALSAALVAKHATLLPSDQVEIFMQLQLKSQEYHPDSYFGLILSKLIENMKENPRSLEMYNDLEQVALAYERVIHFLSSQLEYIAHELATIGVQTGQLPINDTASIFAEDDESYQNEIQEYIEKYTLQLLTLMQNKHLLITDAAQPAIHQLAITGFLVLLDEHASSISLRYPDELITLQMYLVKKDQHDQSERIRRDKERKQFKTYLMAKKWETRYPQLRALSDSFYPDNTVGSRVPYRKQVDMYLFLNSLLRDPQNQILVSSNHRELATIIKALEAILTNIFSRDLPLRMKHLSTLIKKKVSENTYHESRLLVTILDIIKKNAPKEDILEFKRLQAIAATDTVLPDKKRLIDRPGLSQLRNLLRALEVTDDFSGAHPSIQRMKHIAVCHYIIESLDMDQEIPSDLTHISHVVNVFFKHMLKESDLPSTLIQEYQLFEELFEKALEVSHSAECDNLFLESLEDPKMMRAFLEQFKKHRYPFPSFQADLGTVETFLFDWWQQIMYPVYRYQGKESK